MRIWSDFLIVVVYVLLIGATCANALAENGGNKSGAGEPLTRYLERVGAQLDCYFTIEEEEGPERALSSATSTVMGEPVGSIDDAINLLRRDLKGWSVLRSERNPVVVHLIGPKQNPNALPWGGSKVSVQDSGHEMDVFGRLIGKLGDGKFLYGGGTGGLGFPSIRYEHKVKVQAANIDLRSAVTESIPLTACRPLLWHAITNVIGKQTCVHLSIGWRIPVVEQGPGPTTTAPFTQGEPAYRRNPVLDNTIAYAKDYIEDQMKGGKPFQVRWAMLFLGKAKAQDGIPLLLKYIDYKYALSNWLEEAYPATKALSMMGRPGSAAALKALATETAVLRLKILCRVVLMVEGQEAGAKAIEAEAVKTDQAQQQRIRDALKAVAEPQVVSQAPAAK